MVFTCFYPEIWGLPVIFLLGQSNDIPRDIHGYPLINPKIFTETMAQVAPSREKPR